MIMTLHNKEEERHQLVQEELHQLALIMIASKKRGIFPLFFQFVLREDGLEIPNLRAVASNAFSKSIRLLFFIEPSEKR